MALKKIENPQFDPFTNEKDRVSLTNELGLKLIFTLQDNIKIMPTTLVASILLFNRKGVSEDDLFRKVSWLGNILA